MQRLGCFLNIEGERESDVDKRRGESRRASGGNRTLGDETAKRKILRGGDAKVGQDSKGMSQKKESTDGKRVIKS